MAEEIKDTPLEESTELSAIERAAISGGGLGEEPAVETKPAEEPTTGGKSDVDLTALNDRLSKAEERAFAAEQRSQFMAGQLTLLREGQKPKTEEPKPFVFNKDEFAQQLEKDPAAAIHDLIQAVASDKARAAGREVEGKVDGKFGALGQQTARQQRFAQDRERAITKFGDIVKSPEFITDADKAIVEIVAMRTGKEPSEVTPADLAPGDLLAAASSVYGDWAKADKLPKATARTETAPRPLREIINAVPRGESFTSPREKGAKNGAVALTDLYSAAEIPAVRKMMKEFGATEAEWIASLGAAAREDESYAR